MNRPEIVTSRLNLSDRAQDFCERLVLGMRISRRPNMRASIENAPGPSKAIAVDKTTRSRFWATEEKAKVKEASPIKIAMSGVTNPSNKQTAPIRTTTTSAHAYAERSDDLMCVTV